ncbi:MAG: MBL fold metallo-hydrolase, partial [Nanoarchaeota archaeon]|nr:MBL fold metallo-hydrolase [Nanoarchaeota archaeon]
HWHPDHTMGIRIIEQINKNWHTNTPKSKPIDVYMPEEQIELMDKYLIRKSVFEFYETQGIMKLHFIEERKPVKLEETSIEAIRFLTSTAVYYLITEGNKKIVYMPCELEELKEIEQLRNADCLIAHLSWFREKGICVDFPWSNTEQPVERILEFAKNLSIKSIVFMHIDECHDKTPEELKILEKKYKGFNVRFAYDGMKIKV